MILQSEKKKNRGVCLINFTASYLPVGGRSFLFWPDNFATEQDMVNEPIPGIEIVEHERE